MTQINPPFLLKKLRPTQQLTREHDNYLAQLERIIEQTYRRVGGSTDSSNDSFMLVPSGSESVERQKIFTAVTKRIDYTAQPFDFVNAKSGAVITFPRYPDSDSVIIIRNGDGSNIKLKGNGRNINGSTTGHIRNKTTAIQFYYFIDDDEWVAA